MSFSLSGSRRTSVEGLTGSMDDRCRDEDDDEDCSSQSHRTSSFDLWSGVMLPVPGVYSVPCSQRQTREDVSDSFLAAAHHDVKSREGDDLSQGEDDAKEEEEMVMKEQELKACHGGRGENDETKESRENDETKESRERDQKESEKIPPEHEGSSGSWDRSSMPLTPGMIPTCEAKEEDMEEEEEEEEAGGGSMPSFSHGFKEIPAEFFFSSAPFTLSPEQGKCGDSVEETLSEKMLFDTLLGWGNDAGGMRGFHTYSHFRSRDFPPCTITVLDEEEEKQEEGHVQAKEESRAALDQDGTGPFGGVECVDGIRDEVSSVETISVGPITVEPISVEIIA